jgi:uncharacterized protein (UPF0147 family)
MTRILNELEGVDASGDNVRAIALELDEDGNAVEHTGVAVGVYRMNFPILSSTAKLLFAAISVDTSLPKQRRRAGGNAAQEANEDMGVENVQATAVEGRAADDVLLDRFNPGRNARTVCAQTYQNYKSALKWWHTHSEYDVQKG